MRVLLATSLLVSCLSRGLGFHSRCPATSVSGAAARRNLLPRSRYSYTSATTTAPTSFTTSSRTASDPATAGASGAAGAAGSAAGPGRATRTVCNMVLRPDWERDGNVFGLRLPPTKKGERAFEYLVDYPCEFEIKVIGVNEGSFALDIAATVSAVCEVEASEVRFSVRDTSSGRYQSVTVHAPVTSATMLYKCYEVIDEDPRVKFKF